MKSPDTPGLRTGTQSIERAVLLLREIASRGAVGWSLQDLALHCRLERTSVHRILKCLVGQRLVVQRHGDKRYLLGPLSFELGLGVPDRAALSEAARHEVARLAGGQSNMTVVCVLRSGDDLVCLARAGSTSVSTVAAAIRAGQRFPLVSRPSGLAIVAGLDPQDASALLARSGGRHPRFDAGYRARAEALVQQARHDGHLLSIGDLWHGVSALSMPFGPAGDPIGSLTITTGCDDHPPQALRALVPQLQAACAAMPAGPPA